ncbi:hypothetical protein [Acrocarpospora catenulata]|uniref:hypothetical protein n=1 Tax=Acrocarpospora catenulata TaxID=2836182 RepID=UPI001BD9A15F|nr:hypothetical protein [Acrocarpospora catenulata]
MARYLTTVVSTAAIVATAPSGGSANALFANLNASATSGHKLRRVTLGVVAGASVPTSQQLLVAVVRTTARGTATATVTPKAMDPNGPPSSITGLDTAWSAVPTATWTASNWLYQIPFNSQSGVDLPFELLEELICPTGVANGLAFINTTNALPAGHSYSLTVEHEE